MDEEEPDGPLIQSSTTLRKWSARQDLHLRSLGPWPRMLLLHHALDAPASQGGPGTGVVETGSATLNAEPMERLETNGPGGFVRSRPASLHQRSATSWRSTRSQPAVSRRLFRCFGAHLLRSPWTVKSCPDTAAGFRRACGQTPSAERLVSPTPSFAAGRGTSSGCRFVQNHSAVPFVNLGSLRCVHGQTRSTSMSFSHSPMRSLRIDRPASVKHHRPHRR